MKISKLTIPGCFLIEPNVFIDNRGSFVKTYHADVFGEHGVSFEFKEEFYSCSAKGVLRGMHFQAPPAEHDKIVYCPKGLVLDVILDIRSESPTFGTFLCFELSGINARQLFIAKGVAHGFLSLEDDSMMIYKTSSVYSPDLDRGLLWDSFGFNWGLDNPQISDRDKSFPSFSQKMNIF